MSKTILLIDDDRFNSSSQQQTTDIIRGLSDAEIILNEDGTWTIKECIGAHGPAIIGATRAAPVSAPKNPVLEQVWLDTTNGATSKWTFTPIGWVLTDNGLDYTYRNTAANFLDIMSYLATKLGIPLEDPKVPSPQCICITECDCQDPLNGLKSMMCPTHNETPYPNEDCPQHGGLRYPVL